MAANPRKYNIYFGIDIAPKNKSFNEFIDKNYVEIKLNFTFYSYDPNNNITNLLEYFISTFWYKYQYCFCELFLFKLDSGKYVIIKDKKLNLVDLGLDNIYIIQRHSECICEKKYMFSKTDLMAELKQIKKNMCKLKLN